MTEVSTQDLLNNYPVLAWDYLLLRLDIGGSALPGELVLPGLGLMVPFPGVQSGIAYD